MREQGWAIEQIHHHRVGKDRHAGARRGMRADQKIAIAGHEENRYAGLGKAGDPGQDGFVRGVGAIIIADPILEQVAQNVERA